MSLGASQSVTRGGRDSSGTLTAAAAKAARAAHRGQDRRGMGRVRGRMADLGAEEKGGNRDGQVARAFAATPGVCQSCKSRPGRSLTFGYRNYHFSEE